MELSSHSRTEGDAACVAAVETEDLLSARTLATDLPRFCLNLDPSESKRTLAWVDSICLAFVLVGLLGLKPQAPVIQRKPAEALEAAPVVIEPLVTPVQTVAANQTPEEATNEKAQDESGAAVAVTVDSPAVAFSVPTVGNVLVPMAMAQAPPLHPLQAAVPMSAPHIEQIAPTGVGGSRPAPPYPEESLRNGDQGRVLLRLDVDESGKVTSVTIKESSGHLQLDRSAAEYVRQHWFFSPAGGPRQFEAPIVFQLNPNE